VVLDSSLVKRAEMAMLRKEMERMGERVRKAEEEAKEAKAETRELRERMEKTEEVALREVREMRELLAHLKKDSSVSPTHTGQHKSNNITININLNKIISTNSF
jgi:predicted  nucleic acid-binding Zn-ribbon protein